MDDPFERAFTGLQANVVIGVIAIKFRVPWLQWPRGMFQMESFDPWTLEQFTETYHFRAKTGGWKIIIVFFCC